MRYLYRALTIHLTGTILFVALLILPAALVSAQTPKAASVKEALLRPIHLNQANITLKSALAALTQQTGLVFDAQSCLLDREVTLSVEGDTAGNVLTALTELYEWRWVETENGRIYISRQTPPGATTLPEVQEAVRRSLPADFKRYLGLGVSIEKLPAPPRRDGREMPDYTMRMLKESRPKQFWRQFSSARRDIVLDLLDEQLRRELAGQMANLPYTGWSSSLRQLVIAKIVLSTLADPLAIDSFYWDSLPPFQADLNRAEVSLYNGMLLIGTTYHKPNTEAGIISQGFGIVIPEEGERFRKAQQAAQGNPQSSP